MMSGKIFVFLTILVINASAKRTKLFAQNIGLLVDTRMDPLVDPGTCTSHVHSVYGNAQFGSTVDESMYHDADWRNSDGKYDQTTSELIPNLSSYWVPSLYIYHPRKRKYYLVPSFARPYYRMEYRNEDRSTVNPYPPFLRMIVGDASRAEYFAEDETERDNIRWTLTTLNRKTTNYLQNGDWKYLIDNPDVASRNQVEALFKFPQCLAMEDDGITPKTSSEDFRSHVTYVEEWDEVRQSYCPETHPYQVPNLDLEVRYNLRPMRDKLGDNVVNDVRNWRLSTGDATGSGAHADFISGWPEDLMQEIMDNCTDGKSKDGVVHCILEDYDLDGRFEEKTVPYSRSMPRENVRKVTSLPTGGCPRRWTSGN